MYSVNICQQVNNSFYYMAVATSGPNTEILQFDLLISGRIFLILHTQGG